MSSAKTATAPKKPAASPHKKEILLTLKGAVMDRLREIIPGLAAHENAYQTVISSPDLLYGCLLVFRKQRERFQDLLVDAGGRPIADDDTPLRCDRSVNEIIGMVVRSGARNYADARFGNQEAGDGKAQAVNQPETESLLKKLVEMVSGKWGASEVPKPQASSADKFYNAIRDLIDYDWQVPLIPHYAELPPKLIDELGRGLTTLRTADGILSLANIGRKDMEEARRILSDNMMREMLDTQPLAAQGIAFLGKEKYEFLHSAVYDQMGDRFWEMCTDIDRLEMMEDQNAKDLEQIAPFLDVIGADTIDFVLRMLQHWQMPILLSTGRECLGEVKFAAVFGPGGNKVVIKRFAEKVKTFKLDPGNQDEELRAQLPDVFRAYLRHPVDFERGM